MKFTKFTSFMLKGRPDQSVDTLNQMIDRLENLENSIRVVSADKKNVIIIGNQPINPSTGQPYSFGIHTYRVLGDRLEEI